MEQRILSHSSSYKYSGPKFMSGGHSECFTEDVLKSFVN
jgi:hypothetical protein